jgi:hypothetical protein
MAGLLALTGCGGDDDADDAPPLDTSSAADNDGGADDSDGSGDDNDGSGDALDRLIASADAAQEVSTQSGGRVVVAVICEAQTGGTIVSVGSVGVPEGIYKGDFEPAAGGSLTLQVLPDGEGVGARQTALDAPSYTVTFADIDGGIEFTLPGCAT